MVRALVQKGCRFLREGGRHTIYVNVAGARVEVPRHAIIQRGTARNIAAQAGIAWRDFEEAVT